MLLRHISSILVLPVTVTIVVPYLILSGLGKHRVRWHPSAAALLAGVLLAGVGLVFVGKTIRWFASLGRGTLAPWDPPRRLVVTGLYRHVRNPMITGVVLILLGEAAAVRSWDLLGWAAVFFALNMIHIPLVEERSLKRRFGDDYDEYRRHVPRWIPRFSPWTPGAEAGRGRT
jgi:protein-S-isoprenylcysteine O-methyltransferase Ste14